MADRSEFEEYPSPFAHPLKGKANNGSGRSLRVISTTTVLCLIVGIGAVSIVEWARHSPAPTSPVPLAVSAASNAIRETGPASPAGESSVGSTEEIRPSLAFYTQSVRGGMFHPQQPHALQTRRVAVYHRAPKSEPSQPTEPSILPETPANPFVDWSYNGTIKSGDQVMALLENTKTKEGQYVQQGSTFLEGKVERITERKVTLRAAGKTYTLPKSQQITVVPLDKSAPYLTQSNAKPSTPPTAAQATPGQPAPAGLPGFGMYTPAQRAMMGQYWRQYRQMYRGMGGGYGQRGYAPTMPGGQ